VTYMDYKNLLELIAYQNAMVKTAGGLLPKAPMPIKPVQLSPEQRNAIGEKVYDRAETEAWVNKVLDNNFKSSYTPASAAPEKAPEPELSSWESYQKDYKLGPYAEKTTGAKPQQPTPEIKEPKNEQIATKPLDDSLKGVRQLIAGIGGFANSMADFTKGIGSVRNEAEAVADKVQKSYDDYKKEQEMLKATEEHAKALAGGK